jgi:hypothetical protein
MQCVLNFHTSYALVMLINGYIISLMIQRLPFETLFVTSNAKLLALIPKFNGGIQMNRLLLVLLGITALTSTNIARAEQEQADMIGSSTTQDVTAEYEAQDMIPALLALPTPFDGGNPPPIVPDPIKPMPTPSSGNNPFPPMPGSTGNNPFPSSPSNPFPTNPFPSSPSNPFPTNPFPTSPGGFPTSTPSAGNGTGSSPIPSPNPGGFPGSFPTNPFPTGGFPDGGIGGTGIDLGTLVVLGEKIWGYVVSMRPHTEYKVVTASVVPGGITNWTQLTKSMRPIVKVYRVKFKTIFGKDAGGFDYRIVLIAGGTYRGKGKYIGQVSAAPTGTNLHLDRSVNIKFEVLNPINYGTEEDPVAGIQMQVLWDSPTTTRDVMSSAEYFIYGTGEIQDLSQGT